MITNAPNIVAGGRRVACEGLWRINFRSLCSKPLLHSNILTRKRHPKIASRTVGPIFGPENPPEIEYPKTSLLHKRNDRVKGASGSVYENV